MNAYKCIFFDLDHTLWDYDTNAHETLLELYQEFNLSEKNIPDFDHFHTRFKEVNLQLWDLYDRGSIDSNCIRKERFKQILESFNAYEAKLSQTLSYTYLDLCPHKSNLMPYAMEALEHLSSTYRLTVITNGFEDIQHHKLKAGKIDHFFDHVITSQNAGCKKPLKGIFEHALKSNNILCHQAIMIGDNLITDVGGARDAGIDTVYYNPYAKQHTESITYEILSLKELMSF